MPGRATSKWWKEERIGVFVDYNQNARDRTVASAYSVRAVPDARVSCPIEWAEVADVEPAELRLDTVPARLRDRGDPSATIDEHPGSLDRLLAARRRATRQPASRTLPGPPISKSSPAKPSASNQAEQSEPRSAAGPERRRTLSWAGERMPRTGGVTPQSR